MHNPAIFLSLLGFTWLPHLAAAAPEQPASSQSQPNIVLFLVDDYDKPETSVYGGNVLTPNLDRLAREGMIFHNAHVTSTVCTPSRYTFLTGRYAGSSTSKVYLGEFPVGSQGLPAFNVGLEEENTNIGKVLADAGYATGFVGKYHVHDGGHSEAVGNGIVEIPKNAEYSEKLDRQFSDNEKRYRELIRERGFTWAKNIYWSNLKAPFKGHNPEWTISAALEFVEEHKEGPFYLHYCTTLLHGPNGEWFKSLRDKEKITGEGLADKPIELVDRMSVLKRIEEAGLTENEVGYLWMDDTLGLLLDRLDEIGIADDTIVVFVSDHGSNKKGSLFKSRGTEIPCIVRWPGFIAPGSESRELVQNTDFVPTWFEAAGAEVPEGYAMDGVSLLPLFKDPGIPVRDFVYGEQGPARSIKTKDWNFITLRYTSDQLEALGGRRSARAAKTMLGLSGGISRASRDHPDAFDADQLYHLANDPEEQKNVAGMPRHAKQLQEMREMLRMTLAKFSDRPFGEMVPGGNATGREEAEKALEILRKEAAME